MATCAPWAAGDVELQEVVDKLVARQPVVGSPALLDVVSTGMASFSFAVDRREDALITDDEGHLALLKALDANSGTAVPLTGTERIFGLLLLLVVGDRAPMDMDDVTLAESLASRAAAAIEKGESYAELDRRVGHLQHALESRIPIEQAKGMLAARWDMSPNEAFERMRTTARTRRQRIHDLAAAIIAGTDDLDVPGR
jgi:GAF domain-containing protein